MKLLILDYCSGRDCSRVQAFLALSETYLMPSLYTCYTIILLSLYFVMEWCDYKWAQAFHNILWDHFVRLLPPLIFCLPLSFPACWHGFSLLDCCPARLRCLENCLSGNMTYSFSVFSQIVGLRHKLNGHYDSVHRDALPFVTAEDSSETECSTASQL